MSGNSRGSKTKFIIFKIADNKKEVVIDEVSQDEDYEVFREKLAAAKDAKGNPAPRYAVYDVEYDLGGGEGKRYDDDDDSRTFTLAYLLTFFSPQEQDHLHFLGSQRHRYPRTFRTVSVVQAPKSLLTPMKQWSMIYASTRENLKNALNIHTSIHADDKSDIEWKTVLAEASGGKAGK